jgi:hypothetical protein
MGILTVPAPSSGSIGGTLRETITSSTNNYSAPNGQVYAVVAGGGNGNTAGHVSFGYVTAQSRVVIGAAGGSSVFGSLTGLVGSANATSTALTYGMTGAGGTPTGNSNLGYTASGSGGGAGIAGSGSGAAGGLGGGGGSPAGQGAVLVYY